MKARQEAWFGVVGLFPASQPTAQMWRTDLKLLGRFARGNSRVLLAYTFRSAVSV